MKAQTGSFVLILSLMIIPILVLVAMLTVGLSRFYYQHQIIQRHLDQAVILGAKNLPDYQQAKITIDSYLSSKNISNKQADTKFSGRRIAITYADNYQITFADYFINFTLPLIVFSQGEAISQNINLILDLSTKGSILSNENWPSAQFIEDYYQELNLQQYADTPIDLTRKCFNPELNRIKLVALELIDYFHEAKQGSLVVWKGIEGGVAKINNGNLVNPNISTDYCLASAWEERYFVEYQFPFQLSVSENPIVNHMGMLSDEYLNQITLPEVIWGLEQDMATEFDLLRSLEDIRLELERVGSQFPLHKVIVIGREPPKGYATRQFSEKLLEQIKKISEISKLGVKVNLYYLIINQELLGEDMSWDALQAEMSRHFDSQVKISFFKIFSLEDLGRFVDSTIKDGQGYVLLR